MAVINKEAHLDFDENVLFYEIEKYDDTDLDAMPDEVRQTIEESNMKFLIEVVEPQVMRTFNICNCQMGAFIEKNERKRNIMNIPSQSFQPVIEQEDINQYRYAVIVISEHGAMKGVSCIVRECKTCHEIKYWGDIEVFAHLLAEITTNFVSAKTMEENISEVDADNDNPLGPGAILTDIPEDTATGLSVEDIPETPNGSSSNVIDATGLFTGDMTEGKNCDTCETHDGCNGCNECSPED